jgi:two-component system KDP operon response regulator KdpE
MVTTVLIIEDDAVIAGTMAAHLRHAGHEVEIAADGERGLRRLRFQRPDVCIVDLMLPGLDGWAVIEQARGDGLATPMIVVSARASEQDKVHALRLGADDYLTKPFGMGELVARVEAAMRRSRVAPTVGRPAPIIVAGLTVDPNQRRAFLDEGAARTDARLTPTEFRLLWVLAENEGRVMTRDELHQRVWNVPYRRRDRSVDVCVRKLREKLERPTGRAYLHTHFGVGYRFDVEEAPDPAPGGGPVLELVRSTTEP